MNSSTAYLCQLLKRPRILNILQCLLQRSQFGIHGNLCLFRVLNRFCLKRLNGLDLPCDIVGLGLETLDLLLNLVDDGLVVDLGSVRSEVDGGRKVGENLDLPSGVVVTLFEGCEGSSGLALQAEL